MKYAHLENNTKKLLGWYSDDVHNAIPLGSIAVEDGIWQEAININANCYENEKFIVKDFRTANEIEEQRVSSIKAKAGELINKRYPVWKQLNLRDDNNEQTVAMIDWIKKIRKISNEAEANGLIVDEIDWGVDNI